MSASAASRYFASTRSDLPPALSGSTPRSAYRASPLRIISAPAPGSVSCEEATGPRHQPIHLEHIFRQTEPNSDSLRHDRCAMWIHADPPWHSDFVGGAHLHQSLPAYKNVSTGPPSSPQVYLPEFAALPFEWQLQSMWQSSSSRDRTAAMSRTFRCTCERAASLWPALSVGDGLFASIRGPGPVSGSNHPNSELWRLSACL